MTGGGAVGRVKSGPERRDIGYCTGGDEVADSALDGVWDVEGGRYALQEKIPVLMEVLLRYRGALLSRGEGEEGGQDEGRWRHDEVEDTVIVAPGEMKEDSKHGGVVVDVRINQFLQDISIWAPWADAEKLKQASNLLLGNMLVVVQGLLLGAAVEVACSAEGAAVIAALEAANDYCDDVVTEPDSSDGKVSDPVQVRLYLTTLMRTFFECLQVISNGDWKPLHPAHRKLVEIRIQFAVMRRLILSVAGEGAWEDRCWGMPLSSRFLSYCLRVVIVSSVQSLGSVVALSTEEKDHIVSLLAVLGYAVGIRDEKLKHDCRYKDLVNGVVEEGVRRRCASLQSATASLTGISRSVKTTSIQLTKSSSSHVLDGGNGSRSFEAFAPQYDLAFVQSNVNKIIDSAMQFPQPWSQRFKWSRNTHMSFARRFQPSIGDAPGLDQVILPLSVLSSCWLIIVMWYHFIAVVLVPTSWSILRGIFYEDRDIQVKRLQCFFDIEACAPNTASSSREVVVGKE